MGKASLAVKMQGLMRIKFTINHHPNCLYKQKRHCTDYNAKPLASRISSNSFADESYTPVHNLCKWSASNIIKSNIKIDWCENCGKEEDDVFDANEEKEVQFFNVLQAATAHRSTSFMMVRKGSRWKPQGDRSPSSIQSMRSCPSIALERRQRQFSDIDAGSKGLATNRLTVSSY